MRRNNSPKLGLPLKSKRSASVLTKKRIQSISGRLRSATGVPITRSSGSTITGEQQRKRGQQGHVQGDIVLCAATCSTWRLISGSSITATERPQIFAGLVVVKRQFKQRRRTGKTIAPEVKLACDTSLLLPNRIIAILNRQLWQRGGFAQLFI